MRLVTGWALAAAILGASPAAAQTDGQFEPGTSQWQALPEDDGSYDEPLAPETSGDDWICPAAGCVHLLWILPCSVLMFLWIISAMSVIPDWKRQAQYVKAVREAMQLKATPCHLHDVPPSGTWVWKSGVWQQQLELEFTEDGTFTGTARSREGRFLVQGGRFNIETGEFVWEEVIPDMTRGCSALFGRIMWPILMGPYTVFSPIERHRSRDVRKMLSAPRTIVRAKGEEDDAGQWTLGGTYTSYDRRRRTVLSGRVYDLATGKTSTIEVEEVAVRSPVGSPKSLRRSPGWSPALSPKSKNAAGDLLDPWANEVVDIDNEDAISMDLSPKSPYGGHLSPYSPSSPNRRRRNPNPGPALVAAGVMLPIQAHDDTFMNNSPDDLRAGLSPVGSPKSLRHRFGWSPAPSPIGKKEAGDLLDPLANEAVDLDNEDAISMDLSPKSSRGGHLGPYSPSSPGGRRRSPNPSAALAAAAVMLPIRAHDDTFMDDSADHPRAGLRTS